MQRPHFRARFARAALACASVALTLSCAARGPAVGAAVPTPLAKPSREGTLITYKAGREFWRQQYRDDGETLVSELSFGGDRTATVRTSRSLRTVVVEDGPSRVERDIPIGTVALENGDWQAYAIAADWYADAR